MGIHPHALYSTLHDDLALAIGKTDADSIRDGYTDWPGISPRSRAASSLWSSLFKKLKTGMTEETKAKALAKFLQVNSACSNWRRVEEQFGDDFLLGEFKRLIWEFWHLPGCIPLVDHDYDILKRGEVGPGASISSPGGDFYTKFFSSRLSATSRVLYDTYRRYIRSFPEWSNAESVRLLQEGEPDIVDSNRLSFVPKNDDISRSICTEPVLNMLYQLGFGNILLERLQNLWGINLKVQQFKNRELARKGSLFGSFATIDLSSASDSISLRMLEEFLPPDFLRWLVKFRCPKSRLPDGTLVDLKMISTMGNGYTFPLQSVIFSAVVLSAMRMDGLAPVFPHGVSEGNFGVNGDDIVVPTRIAAKVLRLLHLLGFQPNRDKTFVEGPFRESCGGDYYLGSNIRGVFIKRLTRPQDLYAVVNQLNLFSTRTGILLSKTVQLLTKKLRHLYVPRWENDDSGIRVPFSLVKRHLQGDPDLHGSIRYYAWVPDEPPKLSILERGVIVVPRGFKRRNFNLSGLMVTLLQGSVNSHSISLRPRDKDEIRYRRKPRIAPNWDYPSTFVVGGSLLSEDAMTVRLFASRIDWSRWETVVYLNLYG